MVKPRHKFFEAFPIARRVNAHGSIHAVADRSGNAQSIRLQFRLVTEEDALYGSVNDSLKPSGASTALVSPVP